MLITVSESYRICIVCVLQRNENVVHKQASCFRTFIANTSLKDLMETLVDERIVMNYYSTGMKSEVS